MKRGTANGENGATAAHRLRFDNCEFAGYLAPEIARRGPTALQLLCLRAVAEHRAAHGVSPSVVNVARQMQRSVATAQQHIQALRRAGMLSQVPGRHRTLTLTAEGRRRLENPLTKGTEA